MILGILKYFQRDAATLKWMPWEQYSTQEASKFYKFKKLFLKKGQDSLVRMLKMASVCGSYKSADDERKVQLSTQLETM